MMCFGGDNQLWRWTSHHNIHCDRLNRHSLFPQEKFRPCERVQPLVSFSVARSSLTALLAFRGKRCRPLNGKYRTRSLTKRRRWSVRRW
jgi:hypothetical protein